MGKAKKLRAGSHKKQVPPTGGPSQAEIDEEVARGELSALSLGDAQVFQGLTDLQGSVRETTCVALAAMFGEMEDGDSLAKARLQKLLDAGLLAKLLPRLVDPLPMVRLHALGATRNLSVAGGVDVCELLTKQNVVTPLARVLRDNATDEAFAKNDVHAMRVLEQAVALLANVCESCQAAVNELTQAELLPAVMKIAERARTHVALHLEALKLLLLATDSNPRVNDALSENAGYQAVIGDLIQNQAVAPLVKLYAVGVAVNVRAIVDVEANVARLLPVIESALAYDAVGVVQLAQECSETWTLAQKPLVEDESIDDDTATAEEKQAIATAQTKYRSWRDSVHILTLALELVAQLAVTADDNDDEEEWASDDEDAMEEYAASHMDTDARASVAGSAAIKALSGSRAFPLCVAVLQGVISVPKLSARTIAEDFERIRIRVCNAINNLLQSVPWTAMGEDVVPQVFRTLCGLYASLKTEAAAQKQVFQVDTADDLEVAVTAAIWSALRRAGDEGKDLPISADEAQLIMATATQSRSVEARMNAIGMMGSVGQRSKNAVENEAIGRCLLATLNDSSLEVVAQALDAVFDVYGDEDFDDNFRKLQLLAALERTASAVRAKLRVERKDMDRALVAHVKETQLNLGRFIKYKKKHL